MNINKFANLISYVTMLCNREHGSQCLSENEVAEINSLVTQLNPPMFQQTPTATPENIDLLLSFMGVEGKKIEAIKAYRVITGAGLKEAKDAVEKYW